MVNVKNPERGFLFSLFFFFKPEKCLIVLIVCWRRQWQPTPVFLPGESQGWGSLAGCHLWGRTESDTTEAMQQQQQHKIKNKNGSDYRSINKKHTLHVSVEPLKGDTCGL